MKEKIYLETSVISAYFDFREQFPDKKLETRKFWHNVLPKFEVFVSTVTLHELGQSGDSQTDKFLQLVKDIEELKTTPDVDRLVQMYMEEKLFPVLKRADAIHLAVVVVNKIDFLVSWNQEHITRLHRRKLIREFSERHRLFVPEITTPREMLEEA